MPTSQVDVTTISIIDESTSQQSFGVNGALAFFRGITVHPVSSQPNPSPSIKRTNDYDFLVSSVSDAATATVTSASPIALTFAFGTITFSSVLAGDTVTINGLVYTAVTGVKADNTEFSIDGSDAVDAVDLRNSIDADVRVGTLGDISATESTGVVTVTTDVAGTGGNAITLVSSDARLTVTGAGFLTGGAVADTVTINGLVYTAVAGVKADNTEFSIDSTDTATATDLAASVTADVRVGVIGDVIAESTAAVVNLTQTLGGAAGNATGLSSSDGTRLAIVAFAGGTDGPVFVEIATRSITVAKSIGAPVLVSSFFTTVVNDATAAFFVIPKDTKDGKVDYELIYTGVGAGGATLDLNIVTVEVPIGGTAPSFPVVPNILDPVKVFSVLRETTGLVKIYDYFMLSIP